MPAISDALSRRNFIASAGSSILAATALGGIQLAPPDKEPEHLKIPGPASKKLGYAIVGLGELALGEILPAFAKAMKSYPVALVSGHREKAEKIAEHYRIKKENIYSYDNFDSIKDNPAIDIVYIVLPNSMHAEYTIRAAKAGKHVLCEKPFTIDVKQAEQTIEECRKAKRKLMSAYRCRHEPYNQMLIDLTRREAYGKLKLIEASNGQYTPAPNIRLSKELRGGPLGDVGIYCLNATRYITGEEPAEFSAMKIRPKDDPRFEEVAESYTWTQRFPSGVLANCSCSFSTGTQRRLTLFFEKAVIQLDNAFAYNGQKVRIIEEGRTTEVELEHVDQFAKEMDHFSECVMEDKEPLTPGEEGLRDEKHLAAIEKSAADGKFTRGEV